jgi:hypothetical protein
VERFRDGLRQELRMERFRDGMRQELRMILIAI